MRAGRRAKAGCEVAFDQPRCKLDGRMAVETAPDEVNGADLFEGSWPTKQEDAQGYLATSHSRWQLSAAYDLDDFQNPSPQGCPLAQPIDVKATLRHAPAAYAGPTVQVSEQSGKVFRPCQNAGHQTGARGPVIALCLMAAFDTALVYLLQYSCTRPTYPLRRIGGKRSGRTPEDADRNGANDPCQSAMVSAGAHAGFAASGTDQPPR